MVKVAFLGPETSFSHEAALNSFPNEELVPAKNIQEVFKLVEKNEVDFGVVPLENSTEGGVNVTLDMFVAGDFFIQKEVFVEIDQMLLANCNFNEIKKVFSHPQGLAQCQTWLQNNLPHAVQVDYPSTAKAAEEASKQSDSAAIASVNAGKKFNLKVVRERIQDLGFNRTRFAIIANKEGDTSKAKKTSLIFSLKDAPGALLHVLAPLEENKINMSKIESRPSKKKAWDYVFFVDIEGSAHEEKVKRAFREMKKHVVLFKSIGSY